MEINSEYIKEIKSFNSGGGCIIDYVVLKNGKCIGINDECLVLYASEEQLFGEGEEPEWNSITLDMF